MTSRLNGKGFWGFYRKALENGVRYVKARPYDVIEDLNTKTLRCGMRIWRRSAQEGGGGTPRSLYRPHSQ